MDAESTSADDFRATGVAAALAALAPINFPSFDPMEIVAKAIDGAAALCPCRIEATYCAIGETMRPCPPTPIQPHADLLGVVALVDNGDDLHDDDLFALRYGSNVFGVELSHQQSLAEMQPNLRRELVDDLLAVTDAEDAYARADAMGYDLRRPHQVMVIQAEKGDTGDLGSARLQACTASSVDSSRRSFSAAGQGYSES
jgi:hypothetical protein